MSSTNKNVQAAIEANTALHSFEAVVAVLESGTPAGNTTAARKIIAICKAEQGRQLRLMDKALTKEGINAY